MFSQDIAKKQKEPTLFRDTSSLSHGCPRGRNQFHTPCFDRSRYRARCDVRFAFDDHLKHHQENKSLNVLDLYDNSIGDQGTIALADSLKARPVMLPECFSPQARW